MRTPTSLSMGEQKWDKGQDRRIVGSTSLGGEGYHCPYDSNIFVFNGAAKGLAVGGGVHFVVDGRIYVG